MFNQGARKHLAEIGLALLAIGTAVLVVMAFQHSKGAEVSEPASTVSSLRPTPAAEPSKPRSTDGQRMSDRDR